MSKKKTKSFNMYEWMYKHKKKVVTGISLVLVMSMIFGTFMQFIYGM